MTLEINQNFQNRNFCESTQRELSHKQNQTDVCIDDLWILDILDLKNYSPENNRGYRYVLVVINFSSKFGWTIPLKNKNAPTMKDCFEKSLIPSKLKPNLLKSVDGIDFVNKDFTDLLNENQVKRYSRYTSIGAVFAERFNRTFGDLPKRPVFERGDANWIDVLPVITKQFKNRIQFSTKLTAKLTPKSFGL